jgi:SAM-dependent methyltransferase
MPFPDGSFDVVLCQQALHLIADRTSALREMHRVLRPGGLVSIFEPINAVSRGVHTWMDLGGGAAHRAETGRVVEYLDGRSLFSDRMRGFDERDLMDEFASAGFDPVDLVFEHHREPRRRYERWEAASLMSVRPNPGAVSYEEAARAVLGDAAEAHLQRQFELLTANAVPEAWAVAYLTARRDGDG